MDTVSQPIRGDGGSQLDAYDTTGASPPRYYTTTNPGEAAWLCDKWGQPLDGKLAAAITSENDQTVARKVCDKLGLWTFRWTPLLQDGITAYRGGKGARRRAVIRRRTTENEAAKAAWQRQKRAKGASEFIRILDAATRTPLSLEYRYGGRGPNPSEFGDFLTGDDLEGYIKAAAPWDDSDRKPGTFIPPHPHYDANLDTAEVARAAVLWLISREYRRLLATIGLHPNALDEEYDTRVLNKAVGRLLDMYRERTRVA